MDLSNFIKIKKESLEELKKYCEQLLKNDPLWENANNLVFGEGNENAKILIIGEAPGENEDKQGKPFVGKAGKLLRQKLRELNLEDKVYITNLLKLRPPNNRNPTKEEIERHKECLMRQIKVINPDIIVTLGNFSTKFVLNNFSTKGMNKIPSISKLNGIVQKINFGNKEIKVIPIYHPAAVLYNPSLREEFDKAFEKLKELLEVKKL